MQTTLACDQGQSSAEIPGPGTQDPDTKRCYLLIPAEPLNEVIRELRKEDFLLKKQVVDLFHQFEKIGNGTVHTLEIKDGLPFRMTVRDRAA